MADKDKDKAADQSTTEERKPNPPAAKPNTSHDKQYEGSQPPSDSGPAPDNDQPPSNRGPAPDNTQPPSDKGPAPDQFEDGE